YNQHIPQKALDHKTPFDAIRDWFEKHPELFVKNVRKHPGPDTFTLWLVNRFGDAFVVLEEDGSVHMLDVGSGTFDRVADNRSHFADLLDVGDNAVGWLLFRLVDACREAGMELGASQCYGFKVPPVLGGEYEVANVEPTDLAVHYSFLADIYKQTKDLPDGTSIKAFVVE
ncbi:MAG: DUF1851 domain-containing protein, partial [Lysobacterales bacterium]